ncbi:MAG: hypothetical protein IJ306_01035 [Oscillospiraceae bacterium]|nr:hypothetical protein [Oscillospiraceae bacterium]
MSCIGEAVRRNIGKTDPEEACDFAEGFIKEAMLSDKNLSEILDSYSEGNETKKMNVNVRFMAAVLTIIDEARNRRRHFDVRN